MAGLHNYDVATEQECLDDLNELTEDLSWQYQLDDLDKLISKAQEIFYTEETIGKLNQQIAELQKQLKEKDEEIEELQKDYEFKDKDCAINLERFCDALTKNVQLEFLIKDLQSELKSQPAEIVEKIRKSIHYYPIALLDSDKEPRIKTLGISKEVLDAILKEYQKYEDNKDEK